MVVSEEMLLAARVGALGRWQWPTTVLAARVGVLGRWQWPTTADIGMLWCGHAAGPWEMSSRSNCLWPGR